MTSSVAVATPRSSCISLTLSQHQDDQPLISPPSSSPATLETKTPASSPSSATDINATSSSATGGAAVPTVATGATAVPATAAITPTGTPAGSGGWVFTWGGAAGDALGHTNIDKEQVCAFPTRVPNLHSVIQVACGELCSAAVTATGSLWLWGSGRGGRMANGSEANCSAPQRPKFFHDIPVRQVSVGEAHLGCVTYDGSVYTWGKNSHGCLGGGDMDNKSSSGRVLPAMILTARDTPLTDTVQIACGFQSTAIVTRTGELYTCGDNGHGRLGHGDNKDRAFATKVMKLANDGVNVAKVEVGSVYMAAITNTGQLYTWGCGSHGNLGHGTRVSYDTPTRVRALDGLVVTHVACTRGQITVDIAADRKTCEGREGPHTLAITSDGRSWSWGTCHKGILGNMRDKVLVMAGDELVPYAIGGRYRDHPESGASNYLTPPALVANGVISSAIHSGVLTTNGQLHTFGCGSTGRMGIARYMEGLHGGRSRMKCYVSQPTAIETFVNGGYHVFGVDTAKRHMIAVAYPPSLTASSSSSSTASVGKTVASKKSTATTTSSRSSNGR